MDMRRHLKQWLNDAELQQRGGRYEGVIAAVTEEEIRNRYKGRRQPEPVIRFEDGWQVVPNIGMRRTLTNSLSWDTNRWIGQRLEILRHRVTSLDRDTGETKERWEKRVRVIPVSGDTQRGSEEGTANSRREKQPFTALTADDIRWG